MLSGRPTSSASSSWFGLIRCGRAATANGKGAPEVSIATFTPRPLIRRTSSAYSVVGTPGGSEPQPTTQEADTHARAVAPNRALTSASVRRGPASLSLVVVPSGSTAAMFIRADPAISTAR